MYYRLIERRLREPAEAWVANIASSVFARMPGHISTRAYVSESDPNVLLVIEAWSAPELRKSSATQRDWARRLAEVTVVTSRPHWFRAWRWIEHIGERPNLIVAEIERVAPADEAAHVEWVRVWQDELHQRRLAVSQTALRDESDPGVIVKLAEHGSLADRAAVVALVGADPSPVPILESTVFVGRLAFRWGAFY